LESKSYHFAEWYTSIDVYTLRVFQYVPVSVSDTFRDTFFERHTLAEVTFGEWLKRRRKSEGLTQERLARQLNCSTIALRKIEAEERRPSAQIVERLAEIFNIPSSEQAVFLRFARGDWGSVFIQTTGDAPWRASAKSTRSNIPATTTSLVGREKEIVDVHDYLLMTDIRLVTLIGPPGVGKTRLGISSARAALRNFAAGVFFVTLAPLDDPALIAVTIAQALGYMGARNISTIEQLKEGIGDKQMLIVLDNCEHLIDDIASLTSFLLSACSRLKILATSRESLRIPGEWLYPVPALEFPNKGSAIAPENASKFPALTLFAERARAVRPDFVLNAENIKTVSAICTYLDGLPLVIELIAARMRLMSPQALLERLNEQFILTADGMRVASARQKTLQNAIGWSYSLLSEEEQKLFARLSVFSGGFSLEAAETIFSRTVTQRSVSDLIASLLDKSLLQRAFDARGEPRFDMLVTIQQFALNHLRSMDHEVDARDGHLAYFLDLAERGDQEMRGPKQIEWLDRLNAMSDNLRAALEWAIETRQTNTALQMARKLHWFWFVRGDHTGARRWLQRVLEMPDTPLHPEAYAEALTQLAHHNLQLGEKAIREARPFVEQALSVARTNNDRRNIDRALAMLGLVLAEEGNFAAAQSILEESKARFQEIHDEWGYAHAVLCLVVQSERRKDWATALSLSQQAFAGFQKLGDRYFQSVALRLVGRAYVKQGDVTNGVAALRESLILAQQLDNKFQIALVLWRSFAEAALCAEKPARAVSLITAAINVFQSIGAWMEDDDLLFENELTPCRAALGESAFAAAWNEGRAMTMEQAVEYALENLGS
jgi:predicted ATPase/transcriptional regulator with XRE-family HTH domain